MRSVYFRNLTRQRLYSMAGLALVLMIALAMLPLGHASAQSSGVTWKQYDVTIDVQQSGNLHVTERQVVRFDGRFTKGFATIPLVNLDSIDNVRVSLANTANSAPISAEFVSPRDFDQEPGTFTYSKSGGELEVNYGFKPTSYGGSEDRLIVLEYDVIGALRVYTDIDPANQQLWWTAISSDVTDIAPIEAASVTVNLPKSVGETFVASPASPQTDGQSFTWTKHDLGQGDDFEIRLQFPPITAATAQPWQARDDQIRKDREDAQQRADVAGVFLLGAGFLMLIAGSIGIYALWYIRGRDPQVGPVAEYLPEPPDDLRPGAAGTLIDEVVGSTDVISAVLDLARRGAIRMDDKGGRIEFTLLKPDLEMDSSEQVLLRSIFGPGAEPGVKVTMDQVQQTFVTHEQQIHDGFYQELVDHKYFTVSPETTRRRWKTAAWIIPVATIALVVTILVLTGGTTGWMWFPIIVGGILSFAAFGLSSAMPRKTLAGAESAAKWRAFKKYLGDIDKYEKLDESKEIFDKYLPFAVAFGLESSWVNKFSRVDTPMPTWFGGDWEGSANPWTGGRRYGRRGGTWIFMGDPFGGMGGGRSGQGGGGGGMP
ncbi:MAG: DUF2207 domain-containing protein, partial [Thermomicrobiales bacterium]